MEIYKFIHWQPNKDVENTQSKTVVISFYYMTKHLCYILEDIECIVKFVLGFKFSRELIYVCFKPSCVYGGFYFVVGLRLCGLYLKMVIFSMFLSHKVMQVAKKYEFILLIPLDRTRES